MNERKIISMLDMIASEIHEVKHSMATKAELQEVKQNMATKDEFHNALVESQNDIKAMLTLMTEKLDEQDIKFRVMNDRLFGHEVQIGRLKEKKVQKA